MKKVLLVVLLFSATLLQQSCTSSSGLGSLEGQGGGLGSIASLVRSATGASNAEQMARMETSTVVNALNQTKQELPFMYSPQQGFVVYQALNNAASQIMGQSALPQFTTQYPSVSVVYELIALLEEFLNARLTYLQSMTPDQLQDYVQKLQTASTTISNAAVFRGGYGGGMGGQGMGTAIGQMAGMAAGGAIARRLL